jgi:hypothetical protein
MKIFAIHYLHSFNAKTLFVLAYIQSVCPSICLPVSPSVHLYVLQLDCRSIYPSIYKSTHIHLSIYTSVSMTFCLSIHTSVFTSISPSIWTPFNPFVQCLYPIVWQSNIYVSIHPLICLSFCLSVCPYHLSIHPLVCFICLFVHLSVHPSTWLFVYICVHRSIHPSILLSSHPYICLPV